MQASLARKPRGTGVGLCAQKLDITSKTAFIAKGRPVVEQWGARKTYNAGAFSGCKARGGGEG